MYKIPQDGAVVLAIRDVLVKYGTVHSQHELKKLVETELSRDEEQYRVSGERVRRLAILSGIARVEVRTKKNGIEVSKSRCPVCGAKLATSRNKTVEGKTVTLGYVCPKCSYSTGKDMRAPSRYIFSRRRK